MIPIENLKVRLLKVEERTYENNEYLRVRFLHEAEFIDLSYYYNEKNKEKFFELKKLPVNSDCLIELGLNPETKALKLVDWAVI